MIDGGMPVHAAADLVSSRPLLVIAVVLGGLGAAIVAGLALAAVLRRRSRPYLLVALAIGTVLARTVVAALSLNGSLAPATHHLTEHVLDVVMVALVVAAVYSARGVRGGEPA
jgi:hypothetical protein